MRFANLLLVMKNAKQDKEENNKHIWSLNSKSSNNLRKYESLKNDLELIYNHIAEGDRIRGKCDWYE